MTEETKPAPESGYGKEAVRLAELRLVEQTLSSGVQEKKAILISTICFLFVGYLLAFPVEKEVLYKICCWAPPQWSVVFLIKILPSLFFYQTVISQHKCLGFEVIWSLRGLSQIYYG